MKNVDFGPTLSLKPAILEKFRLRHCLAIINAELHAKNQKKWINGSPEKCVTDGWTHGRTEVILQDLPSKDGGPINKLKV